MSATSYQLASWSVTC